MTEGLAMLVIMIAGGVIAGLVAADVKRYQTRERNALPKDRK